VHWFGVLGAAPVAHSVAAMTRTLVLGGTGTTGGRVVDRLAALGLPVRIGSRSAEPPFDWRREATWMPPADEDRRLGWRR
jgi:nucleoside-diphosphate-sugar epimerase